MKSVNLPHGEGHQRANEYLGRVLIDVMGMVQVPLAGGKPNEDIAMDNYTHAVYTKPLHLKAEVVDAFKTFKEAAENKSKKKLRSWPRTHRSCQ
jgi:hypothetical protein